MTNGFDRAAFLTSPRTHRNEPQNERPGADLSDEQIRAELRLEDERRNAKYDAALGVQW